jgi:hypothetical protein
MSQERRTNKKGWRDAAKRALTEVFVEQEFLLDQFSLRAQFDWKVARRSIDRAEKTDAGLSTIFRSPSERVFTRDGVIEFLSRLRNEAAGYVGTRHASTPQIWVFRKGHHTWIEQDASIAPWRYMYFIAPRGAGTSMVVVIQTRRAIFEWLPWLTRTRTARVIVGSNNLIIFPSVAVQSVLCQANSADLKDQTIVLSGWLW